MHWLANPLVALWWWGTLLTLILSAVAWDVNDHAPYPARVALFAWAWPLIVVWWLTPRIARTAAELIRSAVRGAP